MSQIEHIKKHLQAGKTLTPLEALAAFGTFRLAARVLELKGRHGMKIVTDVKKDEHGKTFAMYQEEAAWLASNVLDVGARVIATVDTEWFRAGDCGRIILMDLTAMGHHLVQFNKSSRAYTEGDGFEVSAPGRLRGQWYVLPAQMQLMPGQGVARAH